jgi:glyoxylase-like metal-dependent hydrolase (beta-lactamase superfamily II)
MSENPSHDTYDVYALRYGNHQGLKSKEYYGFARYGDDDGPADMAYYFWLARNADRTVLVDCGYEFESGLRRGRQLDSDPVELVSRLGVSPDDVDHLVISHMHNDHIGNLDRFPNATFSIAREEYDFCDGPYARKPLMADVFNADAFEVVKRLESDGRLHIVEEPEELFPGLRVTCLGGHSPGQLMTQVATSSGEVVLASDAIHFYEELELDRPFWFFHDVEATYRGYEVLRELASRPNSVVVPGHDPEVMSRFEAVHEGAVVDLTAPVGVAAHA